MTETPTVAQREDRTQRLQTVYELLERAKERRLHSQAAFFILIA